MPPSSLFGLFLERAQPSRLLGSGRRAHKHLSAALERSRSTSALTSADLGGGCDADFGGERPGDAGAPSRLHHFGSDVILLPGLDDRDSSAALRAAARPPPADGAFDGAAGRGEDGAPRGSRGTPGSTVAAAAAFARSADTSRVRSST